MTIKKEGNFSIVMILTLVLSMILPQVALAYSQIGEPDNPSLTVHKFEQEPGTAEGEVGTGLPGQEAEGEPLEGVTYQLTQTHAYDEAEDDWIVATAPVEIEGTTGANGQVVFTKASTPALELGRYEVVETAGPDNVVLNTEPIVVDIPMTNTAGDTLNYDVHVYPKNEIIRGDAELTKQDEAGAPIVGVEFGLFNADDTPVLDDTDAPVVLTTDDAGKINVEGLPQGSYYFVEQLTVGDFAINDTPIVFEVVAGEQGQVDWTLIPGFVVGDAETGVTVTNYVKPTATKTVEGNDTDIDRDESFEYNLTMTVPGDIAEYATYTVSDTLDPRLDYEGTWSVVGTTEANIIFDQTGQELTWSVDDLSLLTPGTDVVITFAAKIQADAVLDSPIVNDAILAFDNNKGEEDTSTGTVTITPTEGGVKVIKIEKGSPEIFLEGAEFKLTTDEAGDNIVDATGTVITVNGVEYGAALEDLATDVNGEITIDGLTPGIYYLHETKAPTYVDDEGLDKPYNLLKKPVEVTVENTVDSDVYEVTVENSKSGWNLPTTGGIGTILFTIIGLLLMGLALYLLFRRDKKKEEEA